MQMYGEPRRTTGSDKESFMRTLLTGGVAVFPTDTVYGIGCRIDSEKAVRKVYEVKQRPMDQPMPILLDDSTSLSRYVQTISPLTQTLIQRFWPGSLTIVVPVKPDSIIQPLLNERGNASFRVPNNELLRQVIREVGVPIVGTSANMHGQKTAKNFGELDTNLTNQVDYVFQGETGLGIESTVLEIINGKATIIREGHLSRFELQQVIGNSLV